MEIGDRALALVNSDNNGQVGANTHQEHNIPVECSTLPADNTLPVGNTSVVRNTTSTPQGSLQLERHMAPSPRGSRLWEKKVMQASKSLLECGIKAFII
jgi:hypothetical protein